MRRTVLFAFAAALAAVPLVQVSPASAQVGVTVSIPGNIAFGFSDGYWDQSHHWHRWRNHDQMMAWQRAHQEYFVNHRHEREANAGWRDERWWEENH